MIEHADISSHAIGITCDEAWLYCATLTHNNKYDWRMPTVSERKDIGLFDWDRDNSIYLMIPVRDIK
jgi:hypothetical protein